MEFLLLFEEGLSMDYQEDFGTCVLNIEDLIGMMNYYLSNSLGLDNFLIFTTNLLLVESKHIRYFWS